MPLDWHHGIMDVHVLSEYYQNIPVYCTVSPVLATRQTCGFSALAELFVL